MRTFFERLPHLVDQPVPDRSRWLMVAGALLLVVATFLPLWQIHLVAPQYQEGLDLYIYTHQLVSGEDDHSLTEINNLNRYVGMKPIEEEDFSEMQFMPFLLGVFVLLAMRAAAFGKVRSAVDTLVLFMYFGIFSLGGFYFRLYTYGHNLDPQAPMSAEPFTPVLFGKMEIANFDQYGIPREGSVLLLLAAVCFASAVWFGLRREAEEEKAAESG